MAPTENIAVWRENRKRQADQLEMLSRLIEATIIPSIESYAVELGDDPLTGVRVLSVHTGMRAPHDRYAQVAVLGELAATFEPVAAGDGNYLVLGGEGVAHAHRGHVSIPDPGAPIDAVLDFHGRAPAMTIARFLEQLVKASLP
jgi:hypothetical protein